MDLLMLIWLFPVVLIFHDFEEIMMMEKWVKRNSSTITDKLPPRNSKEGDKAILLVDSAICCCCTACPLD